MKSVIFRDTGKVDVLGNAIMEPVSLKHTNGRSIYVNGDRENGLDMRSNAVGDSAEGATGYDIATSTLSFIKKKVSNQKFFEFDISEVVPVAVGDGAFSAQILTNRSYSVGATFESGNIGTAASNSRLAVADVAVDGVPIPVQNWAMGVEYNTVEVETALVANNWDPIYQKHVARKRLFDLGIQQIALLGGKGNTTNVPGLINNTAVTVNTSFITAYISGLSAANFQTFVQGIIAAYFANTNATVRPNRLLMPMSDFLGFGVLTPGSAGSFPIPMIDYLEGIFKKLCGPDFKIIPNAYCDKTVNNTLVGLNKNVYLLYRHDEESVRMDLPVPYTVTAPGTGDNFTFRDVAYAQYTGVGFYRNLEALMFTF